MADAAPRVAAAALPVGRGRPWNQFRIEDLIDVAIGVSADPVALGERMVDLDVVMIAARLASAYTDKVIEDPRIHGRRQERQDVLGNRAEAFLRNAIAREGVAYDACRRAAV